MGFFKTLLSLMEENENINSKRKNDKLEKQMNNYALEEWQKKLVREGKFDPWDFEEGDELYENDYYYDGEDNKK